MDQQDKTGDTTPLKEDDSHIKTISNEAKKESSEMWDEDDEYNVDPQKAAEEKMLKEEQDL